MKDNTNIQTTLMAVLLIFIGTLSPSNGVDDRTFKGPVELITTMLIIVAAGLMIYFLSNINWKAKSFFSK